MTKPRLPRKKDTELAENKCAIELLNSASELLSQQRPSAHVSKSMLSDAVRALSRLKSQPFLLEIPPELAKEFSAGRLFRQGGTLRDSEGKIRGFLKDASKSKKILTKAPALAFLAMDVAQSVLLNEKLAQIQDQLGQIDDKLKSLIDSKVRSALAEAPKVFLFKQPAERRLKAHFVLTQISEAIPLINSSLESRLKALRKRILQADPDSISIFGGKSRAREECRKIFQEMTRELSLLTSLYAMRSGLETELGELHAACHSRNELAVTTLAWSEQMTATLSENCHDELSENSRPHAALNLFSFEGFDYARKTKTVYTQLSQEANQLAASTTRDCVIATAITPKIMPTYLD